MTGRDDLRAFEAQRNGSPPKSAASDVHLHRLDVGAMLATEPEPVDWIVNGMVARGTLTMLAGREKQGKSLVALAVAATVANGGGRLAEVPAQAGRVLIVDAENGEREIHRRLKSLGLRSPGRLEVFEARGLNLVDHLDELDDVLDRYRPDLVVLDSWRSLWSGDENDAGAVAAVLDPLRNVLRNREAGSVLIHHKGKGPGGYRGSTAAGASVENVLELDRDDHDEDRRRRRLRNPSCRYAQEAADRWLRIEADPEHGRLLIEIAEPFKSASTGGQSELRREIEDELGNMPRALASIARAVGKDPKNRTVRKALDALAEDGIARKEATGWVRVSAGVSVPPGHPDTIAANGSVEPDSQGVRRVSADPPDTLPSDPTRRVA